MPSSRSFVILSSAAGFLLVLTVAVTVAPAGPARAEPVSGRTTTDKSKPLTGGKWQSGEVLYRQNCASCHGPNLQGRCMAPSLVGVTRHLTDKNIVAHARKIGEKMCCARHIRTLTDAEFTDIVSYFHAIDTDRGVRRRAERAGRGAGCCCSREE
jgi:mono/diheme cytochrome c family protein